MSQITDAFSELYTAQTDASGAITADFTTPATDIENVGVVIGSTGFDTGIFDGGIGDRGTVQIQCLKANLDVASYTPAKTDNVVLSTEPSKTRKIIDVSESHGVYIITLGDFSTR